MINNKFVRVLNRAINKTPNKLFFRYSSVHQHKKVLTPETVNPHLKSVEYAVTTGPVFQRAKAIEEQINRGVKKPFQNVLRLNIGDPQSLGQPPITFLRQVLMLVTYPPLLRDKKYAEDAKSRARNILDKCPGGSVGSYSDACGMEIIRRQIAQFLETRDKNPANWRDCIMGHGAGDVAKKFLFTLCDKVDGLEAGILNPVPESPIYSSALAELGLKRINYYLEEDDNWNVNINELQRVVDQSRTVCNPRAIIVINPGNPTGHVLTGESIEEIIKFAHKENLIIIADEVYQNNILKNNISFVSFKKVMCELGRPYNQHELVSTMSVSKGLSAESGLKGGFGEIVNIDPEVVPMFVKSISASLCPSVLSQVAVYAFTNPPTPNEPSYDQFKYETSSILGALKMSATILEESFNSLEGVSCNPIEGALFAYPQLMLPQRLIREAEKIGCSPDEFYAVELLNETGICVVPGTGFGQPPGKYHIRMSILPDPNNLHKLMEQYKKFHHKLMKKYSDLNTF